MGLLGEGLGEWSEVSGVPANPGLRRALRDGHRPDPDAARCCGHVELQWLECCLAPPTDCQCFHAAHTDKATYAKSLCASACDHSSTLRVHLGTMFLTWHFTHVTCGECSYLWPEAHGLELRPSWSCLAICFSAYCLGHREALGSCLQCS